MKNSSCYFRGDKNDDSLQRIYGVSFPDKKLMTDHKKFLEEAKERDHRKIGIDQELFLFDDGKFRNLFSLFWTSCLMFGSTRVMLTPILPQFHQALVFFCQTAQLSLMLSRNCSDQSIRNVATQKCNHQTSVSFFALLATYVQVLLEKHNTDPSFNYRCTIQNYGKNLDTGSITLTTCLYWMSKNRSGL